MNFPRPFLGLVMLVLGADVFAGTVRWGNVLQQPAAWYASAEGRAVAANMLAYQTAEGGWPTDVDTTQAPSAEFLALQPRQRAATLDDRATTRPLTVFARVVSATGDATLRAAFLRGFDYLLAAQYPNGGWPQYFPLKPGYHSHITYNDGAMIGVMSLLRDAAQGKEPFAFVDADRRARAAAAVARGMECVLRTQVKQDGKLTVWCAQHDENTLAPAGARHFEPPSLSGAESADITRFLMGVENPSPAIIAAIEGAMHWFQSVAIHGLRIDNAPGPDGKNDRHAVADHAAPALWARFYELGTNRPIFIGRDKVIHFDFNAIERERRTGYTYLGTWPEKLLAQDYPRWRARHHLP
ncbi:MAG: pectate lyase [Opitutaceae bacterium]|nr:pectate lyase [Opitutaceae bacterium]